MDLDHPHGDQHHSENGSTHSRESLDEAELLIGPKQKKRMRIVFDIAEKTRTVLYKYNKKNLSAYLQTRENVIILYYFLG